MSGDFGEGICIVGPGWKAAREREAQAGGLFRLRFCRRCGQVFVEGAPDGPCVIREIIGTETAATIGPVRRNTHDFAPLSALATDPPGWAKEGA